MASIAAQAVAEEVLETVGKGIRPNISKIAVRKGYKPTTAGSGNIQKTKTYKAALAPLVQRLEAERDAVIKRLADTRERANYRDLMDGLDKLTKNIQLLTGKSTDNVQVAVIEVSFKDQ